MRTGLIKYIDGLRSWMDQHFPDSMDGLDPPTDGTEHIRAHVELIISELHKLRTQVNIYWGQNG